MKRDYKKEYEEIIQAEFFKRVVPEIGRIRDLFSAVLNAIRGNNEESMHGSKYERLIKQDRFMPPATDVD